jgi:hypothetical protein
LQNGEKEEGYLTPATPTGLDVKEVTDVIAFSMRKKIIILPMQ